MENNKEQKIEVLKVDATVDELILKDEAVLIEVKNRSKSGLILDNNKMSSLGGTNIVKWVIVKIGSNVESLQVGDSVYDLQSEYSPTFFEMDGQKFILTDKYNVKLAVR